MAEIATFIIRKKKNRNPSVGQWMKLLNYFVRCVESNSKISKANSNVIANNKWTPLFPGVSELKGQRSPTLGAIKCLSMAPSVQNPGQTSAQ